MKRNFLLSTLLLSAALAVSAPAHATSTQDFLEKASVAGMFEIESSKVALSRTQNTEVKAFAQQMIDDHTKASAEMKAAATAAGIDPATLPTGLDEKHQKKLKDLQEADADDFDDDYINAQVKAHRKAVSLFKDYADDGETPALKDFAAKTLPALEAHRTHAKELDGKL